MATIYPFRALRPRADLAASVAAVPYDVVSRVEARALAQNNPHSFLYVTKPEIDLADTENPYSDAVYEQGAKALKALRDTGVLQQDAVPCLYAYELTMGEHRQTGVALCASVEEYKQNIVRKHEYTRPDKEDDRLRHMRALNAQSGVVFLVHRDSDAIADAVQKATKPSPPVDFTAADGIRHRVWVIDNAALIAQTVAGFAALGPIYIADGHHRSAAAGRIALERPDSALAAQFLAVSFPASQMQILPYNRLVRDLRGRTAEEFMALLKSDFELTVGKMEALAPRHFNMYLDGQWLQLKAKPHTMAEHDDVGRLDVSILQRHVLGPLLGIDDPRRDQRIDFVGGIRGDEELVRRVQDDWAVAFALHATSIAELLAIADAGQVMPPKSTWFEPKLRDGLLTHLLE